MILLKKKVQLHTFFIKKYYATKFFKDKYFLLWHLAKYSYKAKKNVKKLISLYLTNLKKNKINNYFLLTNWQVKMPYNKIVLANENSLYLNTYLTYLNWLNAIKKTLLFKNTIKFLYFIQISNRYIWLLKKYKLLKNYTLQEKHKLLLQTSLKKIKKTLTKAKFLKKKKKARLLIFKKKQNKNLFFFKANQIEFLSQDSLEYLQIFFFNLLNFTLEDNDKLVTLLKEFEYFYISNKFLIKTAISNYTQYYEDWSKTLVFDDIKQNENWPQPVNVEKFTLLVFMHKNLLANSLQNEIFEQKKINILDSVNTYSQYSIPKIFNILFQIYLIETILTI
jgi:hypothetical protein